MWKHIQCYNIILHLKDEKNTCCSTNASKAQICKSYVTQFTVAGIGKEGGWLLEWYNHQGWWDREEGYYMLSLPTRGQHAYKRPGQHSSKFLDPLSIPTCLCLSQHLIFCYCCLTWKAGKKVLGRMKRQHHLNSRRITFQSLIRKVRKKKQARRKETNGGNGEYRSEENRWRDWEPILISPLLLIPP